MYVDILPLETNLYKFCDNTILLFAEYGCTKCQ